MVQALAAAGLSFSFSPPGPRRRLDVSSSARASVWHRRAGLILCDIDGETFSKRTKYSFVV